MEIITKFINSVDKSEIVEVPFLYETTVGKTIKIVYREAPIVSKLFQVFEIKEDVIELFPLDRIERVISLIEA